MVFNSIFKQQVSHESDDSDQQQAHSIGTENGNASVVTPGCSVQSSGSINCRSTVYTNPKVWKANRENVDDQIRILRAQLEGLKVWEIQ